MKMIECVECDGEGKIVCQECMGSCVCEHCGDGDCPSCYGEGGEECPECDGKGEVEDEESAEEPEE
jgi:hypothetical protein